ncbi:MAG: M56 family metallopeptidase [Bacteroidota bacterium]
MENLLYNISQVLGITIIHSLWQGLILFIALRLFMLVFTGISSAVKYWVSYGVLTAMLGWFVVTLFTQLGQYNWLSTTALQVSPLSLPAIMQEVNAPANKLYFTIAGYMPYLTMLYVVGLVFNTLKLTLAWNSIYRIRQNITDTGFDQPVKQLSGLLGVKQKVQAAFSEWVTVPCITGFIKPIILLPVSITTYLTHEEIEAILLHELAHIKRNDYLLNFIQQVIGILLFFNPFARLIGKLINEERENCCDDMVVRVTGSPFIYAQALLKLEENKQHQWQLALAATGKKYHLLNRIERIMKTKTQTVNIRPVLVTVLALTISISSIAWLNPEIKDGKVVIKNAPAIKMVTAAIANEVVPEAPAPAPKHKRKMSIRYITDTAKQAAFNDTTKKKYKIVVEDEQGNKKEYNSVNDLPAEDRNDFYKDASLFADTTHLKELQKFYQSDKWKKQTDEMQKHAMAMAKQFDSPEWKKHQKALVEQSMAMAKRVTDKKWQKQAQEMAIQSKKIAEQFNGPEFAKKMEEMQKSGVDMVKYYQSPEFTKTIEGMTKYYSSPEFLKQVEGMTKYYDSPKFKKSIEKMTKYYDSPEFKKQVEEMQKSAEKMEQDVQDSKVDSAQEKAARKDEQKAREAEAKDKAAQKEVKPQTIENAPL